jgi:2',3'-cyclic-nucleotide 2'-phosphodiesterase (5'-nucleotidase family)
MIKRGRIKILLLFFISLIFFNCTHTRSVSFLYTGKSNGILENCNCPKNKYGGLLNRLYFFKNQTDSVDVFLDSGDIFSYRKDQNLNHIIQNILPKFQYAAITPGELDLEMIKQIDDIFVSQNVYGIKKEKFIEINNINICITGAIDPTFVRYDKNNLIDKKIGIKEINSYTNTLKSKCDVLIFLSHLESEKERKVFIENTNIDIMISGHSGIKTYEKFGNRIYVSPGMNSEFVGKLNISMNKNDKGLYKISNHKNRFYSMHIDSIPVNMKAKNIVDSMKKNLNMEIIINKSNDYE